MLDQVCNAINILKPFGTCLILLLSSSLPLFLYWPILIYLFLPWPTLSYQIPPFQLAQTQGEAHGYEVKGGLQISLWNGNSIHKCSSHVHNSGPDSVRDKRMERPGPKPLQGALCSSQLEYSPLLSHTWSSQQPPEPPSARLCLVLCWIKEGLKMTEMCLAQSWRGASTAATKGQWQRWCLWATTGSESFSRCHVWYRSNPAVSLWLCFSLFTSQLVLPFICTKSWYFPGDAEGTEHSPQVSGRKWRFFPQVSLSNLLFLLTFLAFCISWLLPLIKVLFVLFAPNIFGCPVC